MAVSVQNDGAHPGEYRRETGLGMVVAVDRTKGRNVYVTINAEHLQEEVKAWADTHTAALAATLDGAYATGQRIAYVIDVHRTRNVDPAIPFEQLGKRQKVRDLTGLTPVDGAGNPIAAGAAPPASTPATTPSPPPAPVDEGPPDPAPPGESYRQTEARVTGAARGPHAPCPRCGHPLGTVALRRGPSGMEHVECPAGDPAAIDHATAAADAGAQADPDEPGPEVATAQQQPPQAAEQPAEPSPGPTPPAQRSPRRGRVEEGRPWEFYNSDGSINLGSYAAQAAVGFTELAASLILEHDRTTAAMTGTTVPVPDRRQVLVLARYLLGAADRVQAAVRADGKADRLDASHTRARGAIRSALDLYPVPFGATADVRARWLEDLTGFAVLLLEVAVELTEVGP